MKKVDLQYKINWLECRIQELIVTVSLIKQQDGAFCFNEMTDQAEIDIIAFTAILDELYLLLERDQKCDECVFNHFENSIQQ